MCKCDSGAKLLDTYYRERPSHLISSPSLPPFSFLLHHNTIIQTSSQASDFRISLHQINLQQIALRVWSPSRQDVFQSSQLVRLSVHRICLETTLLHRGYGTYSSKNNLLTCATDRTIRSQEPVALPPLEEHRTRPLPDKSNLIKHPQNYRLHSRQP